MRVKAKLLGYYDNKRFRPGQEFELVPMKGFKKHKDGKLEPIEMSVEQQFSEKWMESLDGKFVKTQAPAASSDVVLDEVEAFEEKPTQKSKKKKFFGSESASSSNDDDVI